MRVLVTGSRDWDDRISLYGTLFTEVVQKNWEMGYDSDGRFVDWLLPRDFVLLHGACPTGADFHADQWCLGWNFVAEQHPAKWEQFGKAAGFIRNTQMVDSGVDLCLAFIKNKSHGATHCANYAEKRGVTTLRYTM